MPSINFKNAKIYFTSQGEGNTIVFLHGFLENLSMWQNISPVLAKNNRVICIDLLGHGKTESLGYIHSMEEQAQMVKFVLNFLKLRKYIIIGHSMGGYVGLAFAELFPKNIKKLVLMNSTAMADSDEKKTNRDRGIKAVKHNAGLFVKLAIPNLFSNKNKKIFSKEIDLIIQKALQMTAQGIIAAMEGMKIRKDRRFVLKTNSFPILMIISKQDPALDYQSLISQIKNTPVLKQEFPDGHMSHIENKQALLDTFISFLK
ncbi:MAG: alpha/beta fold hydrolase [Flavobacteriaceae bacterium]|nr:alpha/beta fold hydrolase [Flavobacteriaceae bacterium]